PRARPVPSPRRRARPRRPPRAPVASPHRQPRPRPEPSDEGPRRTVPGARRAPPLAARRAARRGTRRSAVPARLVRRRRAGAGGSPTPSTVVPTPVDPGTPAPTYQLYSLLVRFGDSSTSPALRNLPRLKGLPGGSSPKLIYLGLLSDHKTAVFLVDAAAQVRGD